MPTNLLFCIGPTGAGKSRFLAGIKNVCGDAVHLVEVGKALRAKYPPSYFEGQAAPTKTAAEAWQLCQDGISAGIAAGKPAILIDGQPRSMEQVIRICHTYSNADLYGLHFIHLCAPPAVRAARLAERDTGDALELAKARLIGDVAPLYENLSELLSLKCNVITVNTERQDPVEELLPWIRSLTRA